ncbi:MAG: histidine triad nucleotide-binding protein [Candidatus Dadabacteria bacterium]|nr:histidine triad nucleotide-binding protein [Candidatus Dadabacteria bacterium]NIS07827.1 histidine triad nucleotide-binding protein [Candidatus Dadabacteria bacterium]NIV42781.1 HIT domain-containing protein [Candidatus Dadabacteria bacterium]NIX14846.1 HIT domain-containing protein [Candidatus Dadabacteria bacterium]NIY21446.1 HIT domain-containing protein [Candidatus Dadabacteria bacterium]
MEDCIFCKIVNKELPSNNVYEDDKCLAFHDISPQAPTHILVIPKKHIRSLVESEGSDTELLGHLTQVARDIAEEKGLEKKGFRLVLNSGLQAGQSVWHIHFHLLGGRKMSWPPG